MLLYSTFPSTITSKNFYDNYNKSVLKIAYVTETLEEQRFTRIEKYIDQNRNHTTTCASLLSPPFCSAAFSCPSPTSFSVTPFSPLRPSPRSSLKTSWSVNLAVVHVPRRPKRSVLTVSAAALEVPRARTPGAYLSAMSLAVSDLYARAAVAVRWDMSAA